MGIFVSGIVKFICASLQNMVSWKLGDLMTTYTNPNPDPHEYFRIVWTNGLVNNENNPYLKPCLKSQQMYFNHDHWVLYETLTLTSLFAFFFVSTQLVLSFNEAAVIFSQFTALPGCKQEVQQINTQLSIWTLIHNRNPKLFHWPQTDCVVHCWARFEPCDIHSSKFTRLSRKGSVCVEERFLWCLLSNYWCLTTIAY